MALGSNSKPMSSLGLESARSRTTAHVVVLGSKSDTSSVKRQWQPKCKCIVLPRCPSTRSSKARLLCYGPCPKLACRVVTTSSTWTIPSILRGTARRAEISSSICSPMVATIAASTRRGRARRRGGFYLGRLTFSLFRSTSSGVELLAIAE